MAGVARRAEDVESSVAEHKELHGREGVGRTAWVHCDDCSLGLGSAVECAILQHVCALAYTGGEGDESWEFQGVHARIEPSQWRIHRVSQLRDEGTQGGVCQ